MKWLFVNKHNVMVVSNSQNIDIKKYSPYYVCSSLCNNIKIEFYEQHGTSQILKICCNIRRKLNTREKLLKVNLQSYNQMTSVFATQYFLFSSILHSIIFSTERKARKIKSATHWNVAVKTHSRIPELVPCPLFHV